MITCDYCKKKIKKEFVSFETEIFEDGSSISSDNVCQTEHLHKACAEKLGKLVYEFIVKELKDKK